MSLFDLTAHQMKCSKGDFTNVYLIQQINGQLIATFKHVSHPKRGTEVFIKKLPRDILLQDILEFTVRCGDIYRIRLLMDFSGYNRGYCFVTYFDVTSARKAILTLNGERIKDDATVLVKISFDNNKLEMRGIPREINRTEILEAMSEIIGEGLKGVIIFKKNQEKPQGGTCLLKYDTHKHALEARKKVWPRINLWHRSIDIDWAVPHEVLNCKRLYFKNAPEKITKLELYEEVTKFIKPEIMLNIFLQFGLGYLLFTSGSVAFDSYMTLRSKKICGQFLEFSFTKFYPYLSDDNTDITERQSETDSTLEDMNETHSCDPISECQSSSADETVSVTSMQPLTSTRRNSSETNFFLSDNTLQYSDFAEGLSWNLPPTYENPWTMQASHPLVANAVEVAGRIFPKENTVNGAAVTQGTYPLVVVPPPIVTFPPYDEVTEIHECVSHYFNFNHPTIRWIYTCSNEISIPNMPCEPYTMMVRILPTINHNQYDLTLIPVPRALPYS